MSEAVTIDELAIADEPERWTAASFAVQDSCCQLGCVRLRLAGPQRTDGAIESRREDDHVIDRDHAVGMGGRRWRWR